MFYGKGKDIDVIRLKACNADVTGTFLRAGENLFTEARELLKTDKKAVLYTKDPRNGTCCRLERKRDVFPFLDGQKRELLVPANMNFYGCDLIEELPRLDLTLVDAYQAYVFTELNEYTFEIARLLRTARPERPLLFRDPRADWFFSPGSVTVIPGPAEADGASEEESEEAGVYRLTEEEKRFLEGRKCLLVTSVNRDLRPECGTRPYYDCQNVLNSLCWARKHRHYGSKNPGKTVFLIDLLITWGGFGDIIKTAHAYSIMAEERGWIPAVRVRGTQYTADPETNTWDLFFLQPGPITVKEALESDDVIDGAANGLFSDNDVFSFLWNPYFREAHQIRHPLRLREELEASYRGTELGQRILRGSVFGVVARGTDLAGDYGRMSRPAGVLKYVEELIGMTPDRQLFLATEDEEYFDWFRERFGDSMLCVPQKRVRVEDGDECLIRDLLAVPDEKKEEWGRTYLFILWCLSHCFALGYLIPNGSLEAAQRLSLGRSGKPIPMMNLFRSPFGLDEVLPLVRGTTGRVLVYGAGISAEAFLDLYSLSGKEVLIFDRKAETREVFLRNYRVLPPADVAKYAGERILVTPYWGREEITEMLIGFGFAEEDIVYFPPVN